MVRTAGTLLGALPVLCLAVAALAWLRYGIDMPWFDDWRGYAGGWIHSLHPTHLLQPINYTLSPVGLALDALAQRYLDGNSIAYQLLSMLVVLGGLLWVQWRALCATVQDRLQVAVCFLLTVWMLQPGSYWGLENLAYHQALPLLFIAGGLLLACTAPIGTWWAGAALTLLGLLAGFSYISGAFGATSAACVLLAVAAGMPAGTDRQLLVRRGLWFLAGALVTLAAQSYFSFYKTHTSPAAVKLALPHEAQFWWFYLGKLGRALLLPSRHPLESLAITLSVCAAVLWVAWSCLRAAWAPAASLRERRFALFFLPLLAAVGVYLLLVAAGRTNFRSPELQSPLEIFVHAYTRFHFFWATALWPWVAAGVFMALQRSAWGRKPWILSATLTLALVLAVLGWRSGAWDHMASQRQLGQARESVAYCLLTEIQKSGEVRCRGLLPPQAHDFAPDARPAYVYGVGTSASFVRTIPLLPGARFEVVPPFFRVHAADTRFELHALERLGEGAYSSPGPDPWLYVSTERPEVTHNCSLLQVDVEIEAARPDRAQLYFAVAGQPGGFSEGTSVLTRLEGGGKETLGFRLESSQGFEPRLRFDPVMQPQQFTLGQIKASCLRPRAP